MLTIFCESKERKEICSKDVCCCECGTECSIRCGKELVVECTDFVDDVD